MICDCGKEFIAKRKTYGIVTKRYCSRQCNARYNPANRHAWLFNKNDLKAMVK